MKKIMLAPLFLLLTGAAAIAQCGKKTVMVSDKTEYFNGSGELQRTVDEKTVVEIEDAKVKIAPGEDGQRIMTGNIKSDSCKWKTPFKEGKTVVKIDLTDERGELHKDVTLTIEGKNGLVTLLFEAPEIPDKKIKITAVSYGEKK